MDIEDWFVDQKWPDIVYRRVTDKVRGVVCHPLVKVERSDEEWTRRVKLIASSPKMESEIVSLRAQRDQALRQRDHHIGILDKFEREAGIAARQDAEEKARLREALTLALKEIKNHNSDYHHHTFDNTIQRIESAIACTPTGVPNGVQQTEEKARLTAEVEQRQLALECKDQEIERIKASAAEFEASAAEFEQWAQETYDALHKQTAEEITRLREALEQSFCPNVVNDVRTTRSCVNLGYCHCKARTALACRPQRKKS